MKQLKIISITSLVLVLGLGLWTAKLSFAHGGNTHLVHTCVLNLTGTMRWVSPSTNCGIGETAVDFNGDGVGDFGGFTTDDLSGINLNSTSLIYRHFANANFTNADLRSIDISNSNLTNANFTGANIAYGAVMTNTNLTNANFSNADLTDAVDMDTATIAGATWSNTTCPDGTNSNSHSNTCAGHLVP